MAIAFRPDLASFYVSGGKKVFSASWLFFTLLSGFFDGAKFVKIYLRKVKISVNATKNKRKRQPA